jgi:hypothetical protein
MHAVGKSDDMLGRQWSVVRHILGRDDLSRYERLSNREPFGSKLAKFE